MTPNPRQLAAIVSPLVLLVSACGTEADAPEASPGQAARPVPGPVPAAPVGEAPDPPAQPILASAPSGDKRVRLTPSAATGDKRIRIAPAGASSGRPRSPSAERSPSARPEYRPEAPLDPQPSLDPPGSPPVLPNGDLTSEPS
jgi:hypothetical protein